MTSPSVTRPLPVATKQPSNPISGKQVERVISRSVAVFGIVFGAQTIPWLLGQLDEAYPIWLWIVVPALFGTLIFVFVMSFLKIWVRQAHGLFAIVYLVTLVSWPFMVMPEADIFSGIHWLNYLITVATSMAAIAFSTTVGTIYLFTAPTIYLLVRMTPLGGGAPWQLALLEGIYALILGAAVVIIITMLRQAAASVDGAQAMALDRYGHAVRQHATEVERVQVDSIVHDSVLTTLISAARADTVQAQQLAATMAGNAIGFLRDAAATSPDDGSTVPLRDLAERIADAAAALSSPFALSVGGVGDRSIPVNAAETIYSAAVQAMVNSLQHAGEQGIKRWVEVRGLAPAGIEVVVGDTGIGFAMVDVPPERLGVRVSIIERAANVGGSAAIKSAPGEGTIVSIRWPHSSGSLAVEVGETAAAQ
jgi:hypothetical protein